MAQQSAREVWQRILEVMDEKLQYGLLEQARAVVDVQIDAEELVLLTDTEEAYNFFCSTMNQQRLMIMARPILDLEKVIVRRAPAA